MRVWLKIMDMVYPAGSTRELLYVFESEELHNHLVSLGMAGERMFQRIPVEYERAEVLYAECHIGHNSKNNSTS